MPIDPGVRSPFALEDGNVRKEPGLPEPLDESVPFEDFAAETNPPLRDRPPMVAARGLSDRQDVEVRHLRPRLGPRRAARISAAAERSAQVRRLLGRRFAPIGVRSSAEKDGLEIVAMFYSYEHQVAVEARLDRQDNVISAQSLRIQPPLTDEELERCLRVARRAIGGDARTLSGGAIVVTREEPADPLAGRRLADVRFFEDDRRLPRYHATVDVATRRVIESGEVEGGYGRA